MSNGPLNVFLSYARADDEPFVRRLCDDLTVRGFNVWFDRDDLRSRGLTFHHEIRDAIIACDRLVLIVGPQAAQSEYVRQEWQFAWFDAEKVVTPILRKPSRAASTEDDYKLIPDELKLLHCEDFRDDTRYQQQLEKLIASLWAPPPRLGQLISVPSLPSTYLSRSALLAELRDAVRAGLDGTAPLGGTSQHQRLPGIIGRQRMGGMAGMGGIGKSVLASLLAHDRKIREAFPDGIVWVTLGSLPHIEELQRRVHRDLGGDGAFQTDHEGKSLLKQLLADKSVLLILDDAWRKADVEAFDVLGPTCRALITTRDAQLITSLGGMPHLIDLLSDREALHLLAATIGQEVAQLPPEATQLIRECGRLPLAVALAGGMIADDMPWAKLLAAFMRHKQEFFQDDQRDNQHHDLLRMIEVSVQALLPAEQSRLVELGVFPEDETVPEAAIATFWHHTGGLDDLATSTLLNRLKQRSLIQLARTDKTPAVSVGETSLHDLIQDYCLARACKELGREAALHQKLLDAYRHHCTDGWSSGPDDGYFFTHLVHHLAAMEDWALAGQVVTDFRWLMRKCELKLLDSIGTDYERITREGPGNSDIPLQVWQDFFREQAHILRRGVEDQSVHKILLQLALEHADDSPVTTAAETWLSEGRCNWLRLQRVPRLEHLTPNPGRAVLEGHRGKVRGALLLADGRIVSWSDDQTLRVWDAATGACRAVLKGHTSIVWGALLLADGRIVSWSDDQTLRVWDAATGACRAVLKGHTRIVRGALLLPDGRVLSWSEDNTLRVWDAASGASRAVLEGHTNWVTGALSLPDGRILSWSGDDKTLRVWDAAAGACHTVLEGHMYSVNGALLLPNGRILSWSNDFTLRLWDQETWACRTVLKGHTSIVWGAMLLPGGRILSWSGDNTLREWDAATGACRAVLKGHTSIVRGALLLADGRILSWSGDKTLRVWDAATGACRAVLEGHTDMVDGALSLADGRILSWSYDGTLRVWDQETWACRTVLKGHTSIVWGALLLPDGRILSWSGDDKTLRVWDAATGACRAVTEGHTSWVTGALSLPDGRILSWSGNDKTLRLWDASIGVCRAVLEGHMYGVEGALLLTDGRILSWSAGDKTLRVWDAATGACRAVMEGHTSGVWGALSLADGRILSWSFDDNTLRLWDAASGACRAVLEGHTSWVTGAQSLLDGRVLSWSKDKSLRVWDVEIGACRVVMEGHTDGILGALSLADGRVLSWSLDKTLRVWDAETGACRAVMDGHTDWVWGAVSLADGRILSWERDNMLRVWDAASWACLEVVPATDLLLRHPDWFHAKRSVEEPANVAGDWIALANGRTTRLFHRHGFRPLPAWQAESDSEAHVLQPDGTLVVGQRTCQVCILKLHHGGRRVSLAEAEELLRSAGPS